ncbi:MAG TPA: CocE/NonD family hydrolase, partial [Puia sp.]|nr:CocE/NonD family hydrolase [Puia sp.]
MTTKQLFIAWLFIWPLSTPAQTRSEDSAFIVTHYSKMERMIPMRDGVRLFTAIYAPKNSDVKYPFLMERTPYSCAPYGEKNFSWWSLGPNRFLVREQYIFVYQDVRGRHKSEGHFEEMTPARDGKKQNAGTDESTDTYDTIEWLLKNIGNNNGRVGIYGISYPGFYASASLPLAHPAIRAVSPQAPVTDEFIGDDAYHNGAFFLLDNFDFTNNFEGTKIDSGARYKELFPNQHPDAYQFFLNLGPIKNSNGPSFFNKRSKIWSEYLEHDTYDAYWKARNIRTHLRNILPAVLVVGGWFDAEDMFGALRTYEAIEQQSPNNQNRIIMGPWTHGAWSARQWDHFGSHNFKENVNKYYKEVETNFFNFYLKDQGSFTQAEATV